MGQSGPGAVIRMVAVRCPWCDARMSEEDSDELSSALMVHFVRVHGLVLPDDEILQGAREGHLSTLAELPDETGEYETRSGSEWYGAELTERETDLYGADGPPRTITVQKSREPPQVMCPLCGFEVWGKSEDDLTAKLREHMRQNNELEKDRRADPPERNERSDHDKRR